MYRVVYPLLDTSLSPRRFTYSVIYKDHNVERGGGSAGLVCFGCIGPIFADIGRRVKKTHQHTFVHIYRSQTPGSLYRSSTEVTLTQLPEKLLFLRTAHRILDDVHERDNFKVHHKSISPYMLKCVGFSPPFGMHCVRWRYCQESIAVYSLTHSHISVLAHRSIDDADSVWPFGALIVHLTVSQLCEYTQRRTNARTNSKGVIRTVKHDLVCSPTTRFWKWNKTNRQPEKTNRQQISWKPSGPPHVLLQCALHGRVDGITKLSMTYSVHVSTPWWWLSW